MMRGEKPKNDASTKTAVRDDAELQQLITDMMDDFIETEQM